MPIATSAPKLTREAYLSAFTFGDEFRQHLTMRGTTKGYAGPCFAPWLWFDIDRDGDLEAATRDARRLCAATVERYGIDGDALLIFFSAAARAITLVCRRHCGEPSRRPTSTSGAAVCRATCGGCRRDNRQQRL